MRSDLAERLETLARELRKPGCNVWCAPAAAAMVEGAVAELAAAVRASQEGSRAEAVGNAVLRIRMWLVQSSRYTASTIELDDVLTREIWQALREAGK